MDNNLNDMLDKMKEYRSASPEFSDAIKVLGTDTPNHAEAVNAATRQLLDNTVALRNEMACNLLYLPDAVNANSAGCASWQGGRFTCNIPSEDITVWSGEIDLPEGGYAYPASSDSADIIVAYTLDGAEHQVEISAGAVLPEGSAVTKYRLERKAGESRIIADIWPMISPGKRPVTEYVPYTGDGRRMNRCVALVLKAVEKLHKFCLEKFLTKEDVANNLVTTNGGWALDARQGKVLKDEINQRLAFVKKNTNVGNTFDISGYMADNWAMLVIGRATSTVPDSGFIFLVSGVGDCFVHVAPIHAAGNCASVTVSNGFLTVNYIVGDGNAYVIPFVQ